ncbi:hypothetical protein [Nannocystis pusilla]|uniref:hypothetical protein n=1 Tax=Nannocystis pusilla TaxID=889268 RepID=UPI003B7C1160
MMTVPGGMRSIVTSPGNGPVPNRPSAFLSTTRLCEPGTNTRSPMVPFSPSR